MKYLLSSQYPIEFVISEEIQKCFSSHNHASHYIISLCTKGSSAVTRNDKSLHLAENNFFVVSPFMPHAVSLTDTSTLVSLCMDQSFVAECQPKKAAEILKPMLPAFMGVELKHILTSEETDGAYSYHLVRIAPNCSIGEHIHETQLETHEVIAGTGACVNNGAAIPYGPGIISVFPAAVPHEVKAGENGLYLFAKFMPASHQLSVNHHS